MVDLPYYRDSHLLPSAIPSIEDIRASKTLLGTRTRQRIVAINGDFAVKHGQGTSQVEGDTPLFLEKAAPNIRVPLVYAMFREEDELFIVMEFIPGRTLQELWPLLDSSKKELIARQLRVMFDSMREIAPDDKAFYGSVGGGGVPHFLFASYKGDPAVCGPFSSEDGFNEALVKQFQIIRDTNNQYSSKASFYYKHLSAVLRNHKPTFTHGDVQRKNIMIYEEIVDGGTKEDRICLLDWEAAGWYPDYWEYFAAFTALRFDDDWSCVLEDFIAPWPAENAMMKMIYTDLFF